jgi:Tol biopolymer transport system component
MNCEKAEDLLSAYLDDMLEQPLRDEVAAHVAACRHCDGVLTDYRHFDQVLVAAPRVEPSEQLRERLFASREFAAIVREQTRERSERAGLSLIRRQPAQPSTDRPAEPAPATPSGVRRRGSAPPWVRVGLQIAAAVVLVLGSALLIRQGLLHSGTPTSQGPLTIGNPNQNAVPLAAGARVVYLRDGALWSAPEQGPGLTQRLTPAGARVAGWQVSPNGRLVAYVDTQSATLHVIRSDDQRDQVLAHLVLGPTPPGFWDSPAGAAVVAGLAWSPDGTRLAYIGTGSSGVTALHLIRADGSQNQTFAGNELAIVSSPVWSPDGQRVAFVETADGAESVAVLDVAASATQRLAAQADPGNPVARVSRMAWAGQGQSARLTWATSDGTMITGIFAQTASGASQRLTPAGMQLAAVDFSSRGQGTWIAASTTSAPGLYTVALAGGGLTPVATLSSGSVDTVVWSPSGTAVAFITSSGQLGLWSPTHGVDLLASNVAGVPVWSQDGQRLAAQVGSAVVSISMAGDMPAVLAKLTTVAGTAALSWAPDGHSLAISTTTGVTVASVDGMLRAVDHVQAESGMLVWTIAG